MIIERAGISSKALQGKVAVVTGAGQGIGRETARILAHLGASVVIADINVSGRETEQVIGREDGNALFVQTDISEQASVEHLHRQARQAYGEVDILVNDAEAFTAKPVLDHAVEEWDRIFAVNLRGAFLGIKAFLPAMLERKQGVIITMESAEGMPYLAPYLASKVGLRSLAFSLAQEVGAESGVAVYCFGAGMVDYITRQEGDARGWIRDPEQLKAALEALRERKKTVQRLVSVLAGMQQPGKGSAL